MSSEQVYRKGEPCGYPSVLPAYRTTFTIAFNSRFTIWDDKYDVILFFKAYAITFSAVGIAIAIFKLFIAKPQKIQRLPRLQNAF